MSTNLIAAVNACLGKDVLSQLSGIVGESTEKTQAALTVAVPTILAGLLKKAASPSGAEELMGSLESVDDQILDDLRGILDHGERSDGLRRLGLEITQMLFGANMNSVLDTLNRTTGVGGKSLTSMLAMIAPVVLSVLKRQTVTQGLGVDGLRKLLHDQADQVVRDLPHDLRDVVGIRDVAGDPGNRTETTSSIGERKRKTIHDGVHSVTDSGNTLVGKLLPIIALLALALIAWQLFSNRPDSNPIIESTPAGIEEDTTIADPATTLQLRPPLNEDSDPSGDSTVGE